MQSVSKLIPWVQNETGNITLVLLFLELTWEHHIADCEAVLLLNEGSFSQMTQSNKTLARMSVHVCIKLAVNSMSSQIYVPVSRQCLQQAQSSLKQALCTIR